MWFTWDAPAAAAEGPRSLAEIVEASAPSDWRTPRDEDLVYLDLEAGRVIVELLPAFAPGHAANVRALARAGYFDGLPILRVQDNYVVQWGDPLAGEPGARPLPVGLGHPPAEFWVPSGTVPLTRLPDADGYARRVGFSEGTPVAWDPRKERAWVAHCYGTVGAARDNAPDSSDGSQLYVVIGQAPRQLDLNITTVGRVLSGMELLAAQPRGPAPMGFYADPSQGTPLQRVRVAADVPPEERSAVSVFRTTTAAWAELVADRRDRSGEWYVRPAGHVDLCAVPVPVRVDAPG